MNVVLNCFSFFGIGIGLYLIITAIYTFQKERKQTRRFLAPHEKIPPWYTNTILRKQSEWLIGGVLLVLAMVGLFALVNYATAFGLFWISLTAFLYSCSNSLLAFLREVKQGVAEQRQDERPYSRWYRPRLYQGIAVSLFFLGISIAVLLNGLVFVKMVSFNTADQMSWFWEVLLLIAVLSWLITWILPIGKACKR